MVGGWISNVGGNDDVGEVVGTVDDYDNNGKIKNENVNKFFKYQFENDEEKIEIKKLIR